MHSEPKRPNLGMTRQESALLNWILSQIRFAKEEGNNLKVDSLRMDLTLVSDEVKARQEHEKIAYSQHSKFDWLREE